MAVDVQIDVGGVDEFILAVERLDKALQEQVRNWLYNWAVKVKEQAQTNAPMRTGTLRESVYATIKEWVAEIGAKATYAYFVEFGTRYMAARPYLYPALQEFLPELEQNIIGAIEQAKTQAGI